MTAQEWLNQLLDIMVKKDASDLLISVGAPPNLKMAGRLTPLGEQQLSIQQVNELVSATIPESMQARFATEREANFAISFEGKGRFRVSAFQQRNQKAMVIRRIGFDIPHLEELSLPTTLGELVNNKRGLVFVVGGTGTGKSTTLASMIQQRNETLGGHIISVEDPIEYVHPHKKAIINQREVGIDTESFEVALKNTLRQAPDVILIGEVRSRETMEHALTFAETGHLCLATLHANNANQALDRIINFFPIERHAQIWLDLSLNLRAIVAQQLMPTQDGGRCPAIEIMLNSPLIGDLVRKGEVSEIKNIMARSRDLGMQTFDQALYDLYTAGRISEEVAMVHADSPNDLRMMIKFGGGTGSKGIDQAKEAAGSLSLRSEDDF
ncbi:MULTISPECIES: PilT/PilU family type 4a pilus ATPase [Halomonas]|uniref:PilT/PilU family type 4a pilus ATPase n=2 Tax=Halomonas TaxID=2745 RepID=A0A7X5AMS6_9GAMM|nr:MULTISPECIES: PilT/PilU family type 4a pilus ATPase [Halomonas]MDR5903318.1 PilT/PilU family type 4a pilus ATPase [Halomonas icarae]NAW14146.1 PilT/PilU family type 4a pilus ATPase [Halomonas icarae]TDB03163.1 PilT/PilU family type 4a pilus ATPase [Halomonas marinisediminis]